MTYVEVVKAGVALQGRCMMKLERESVYGGVG
jgi:hypothetical protein